MTGDAVHGASELKKASASMKVSVSDFPTVFAARTNELYSIVVLAFASLVLFL